MKKSEKEISLLSPDQKSDISSSSILMAYAYAVWGSSLEDGNAIMSKELIDDKVAKYPYVTPAELAKKVAEHKIEDPIQYIIDVPTEKIEEIFLPNLSKLGKEGDEVKVSHFWGNTGFQPGSPFPSDNVNINKNELKKSANSYMGSLVLVEAKNPQDSQLFITFRGSRGGNTSPASVLDARKGLGNPDWITDLDLGGYFHFIKSGFSLIKDALRAITPSEDRSKMYNHEGICRTYYSCKPGIEAAAKELKIGNLSSFPGKIIVTGHSLGGGLATICAYDLRGGLSGLDNVTFRNYTSRLVAESQKPKQPLYVHDAEKIICVSYSAPAVGNDLFVKDFQKLVPNNLRVVINSDPITAELKTVYNLHHVHGKVDLGKMSQTLGKNVGIPQYLKFNMLPSAKAHQIPKVMELAHIVVESKHKYTPLVRTVPKNDINEHGNIAMSVVNLLNDINKKPGAEKYFGLLTELETLNMEIIQFCAKSFNDDEPQKYLDYLKDMLSICQKIQKNLPNSFVLDELDSLVNRKITEINNSVQTLFGNFSPKVMSPASSTDLEGSSSSSSDDDSLLIKQDSFSTNSSPEENDSSSAESESDSLSDSDIRVSVAALTKKGSWITIYPGTSTVSAQETGDKNSRLFCLD